MRTILAALLALAIAAPSLAAGSGSHSGSHSSSHHSSSSHNHNSSSPHGHKRGRKARSNLRHGHACPSPGKTSGACPGYVVDPVVSLQRGTVAAGYAS